MPQETESSGEITSKGYTIPLGIVMFLLALCSLIQGIVAITFGSLFHSFSLSTFGLSSIGQIIIIYYIYHKLVTEHYMTKLLSTITDTATESTPFLNNRNKINSRKVTEKKIAITGMFIFILLAVVTLFSLFYINKRVENNPDDKHPNKPPGDIDDNKRPPLYILLFSIYTIHPFFILIPLSWYLSTPSSSSSSSSSRQSLAWKDATIWNILLFLMAYTQFINSQLLYFVAWKTREIICTLMMAVLFLVYAIRLFLLYLWKNE